MILCFSQFPQCLDKRPKPVPTTSHSIIPPPLSFYLTDTMILIANIGNIVRLQTNAVFKTKNPKAVATAGTS